MANENVMWRIIWFCVFMILALLGYLAQLIIKQQGGVSKCKYNFDNLIV